MATWIHYKLWTGEYGRGARWPGDQARCELLYTAGNMRKAAVRFFVCVGSHCPSRLWLGGKRFREYMSARATLNAQSTRHGARPGEKCMIIRKKSAFGTHIYMNLVWYGMVSYTCTDSAAPPRVSPSILVSTDPVMPIFSLNTDARVAASCPVIASTTSRTSSASDAT